MHRGQKDRLICASYIRRKLLYPEFCNLIQEYDLFCVIETKVDSSDIIGLRCYKFFSQCRKQRFIRKSGGIGVFVKESISPYISVIESASDYILWLKLSKSFLQTDEDFIFGVVYIPPTDSKFNNSDELDLFEVEITSMCISHRNVFLMGDFNARTQNKEDFIDADDFFAQHFGFDDTVYQFYNISCLLAQFNLDRHRVSKDNVSNNEGNLLIEICRSNNLFILNGRCGNDKGIGAFTFRNTSVIDYSLASAQGLKYIEAFSIKELDCLYSDGHALLSTNIKVKNSAVSMTNKECIDNRKTIPKWEENKKADFVANIDQYKISDIKRYLGNMQENISSVNADNINAICTKIGELFADASDKSFPTSTYINNNNNEDKINSKKWFGHNCHNARRNYHIARKINNVNPSETNKKNLKTASKNYKQTMNFHINQYNKNMQEKLRNLKSKNPKDFWKIINSLEKSKDNPNIDLDTLYEFF